MLQPEEKPKFTKGAKCDKMGYSWVSQGALFQPGVKDYSQYRCRLSPLAPATQQPEEKPKFLKGAKCDKMGYSWTSYSQLFQHALKDEKQDVTLNQTTHPCHK